MTTEDRLRELLRDPGWSLPAWPDAQKRIRRSARRQRLALTGIGTSVTAVITAAAAVPIMLLGPGRTGVGPAAGPTPGPFATPAVGAAGFTAQIYPAPAQARVMTRWLRMCPSASGLQVLGRGAAVATLSVLHEIGQPAPVRPSQEIAGARSAPAGIMQLSAVALMQQAKQNFVTSLQASDRAFWPQIVAGNGLAAVARAAQVPVLYSGPLRSSPQTFGLSDVTGVVAAGCGSRVVMDTWVIVSGRTASPARAAETFFLKRHGRVLLYNST